MFIYSVTGHVGIQPATASSKSFTPYAMQLAKQLRLIHCSIIEAALDSNSGSDRCEQMTVHLIKALQLTVRVTPYDRLRPGLLAYVFKACSTLLRSRSVDIRVACLSVFGEVLSNPKSQTLLETIELVKNCKTPARITSNLSSGSTTPMTDAQSNQPWLLRLAIESSAANCNYSQPVRIEALQLLNILLRFHGDILLFEARQLADLLQFVYTALYNQDHVYVAHVCYVLATLGQRLANANEQWKDQIVSFWSDSLSNHIFRLLQTPPSIDVNKICVLKAALLDALSSVGDRVFQLLPANLRILCCTIPQDLAGYEMKQSSYKTLRSAAIRCLGNLVTYPSLQKDHSFVSQCINVSIQHCKTEPACQCAAAWLLRNALEKQELNQVASHEILKKVIECSQYLILRGPDKAKPHAVFVIWRILIDQKSPAELISSKTRDIVCDTLSGEKKIVSGPIKLYWNAAESLHQALLSPIFVSLYGQDFIPKIVEHSCHAILNSPNFRARTLLATALKNLAIHGNLLEPCVELCLDSYFKALCTVRQAISSPSEFKHVDSLMTYLWLGFIAFLSRPDPVVDRWLDKVSVDEVSDCCYYLKITLRSIKTVLSDSEIDESGCWLVKCEQRLANRDDPASDTIKQLITFSKTLLTNSSDQCDNN